MYDEEGHAFVIRPQEYAECHLLRDSKWKYILVRSPEMSTGQVRKCMLTIHCVKNIGHSDHDVSHWFVKSCFETSTLPS